MCCWACRGFWSPRIGAVLGVLAGMLAVALHKGPALSMRCAFWGVFSGMLVAYLCRSLGFKDDETRKRQKEIREWQFPKSGTCRKGVKFSKRSHKREFGGFGHQGLPGVAEVSAQS
jgi:SSS family solute:Na+ symporter